MPNILANNTSEHLEIIKGGLPTTQNPKKIIILGAGMAGLVAGSLLKSAGHDITILEGRHRVGGRVFTRHSPFINDDYLDMGAMRISEDHVRTLEYIKKFNLKVNPFINGTQHDLLFINGILTDYKQYKQNPNILNFPTSPEEKWCTATRLLSDVLDKLINLKKTNPAEFQSMMLEFDGYSVRDFLKNNPFHNKLSHGALDMIDTLLSINSFSSLSFIEFFNQYMIELCVQRSRFFEISGGNDQLPLSLYQELQGNILFNKQVTKLDLSSSQVIVEAITPDDNTLITLSSDLVITTLPFSTFRLVKIHPYDALSYKKRKAIRNLHYGSSVKIGIQFKNRFWETNGSVGGKAVTDLPIRYVYYPSHQNESEGGVLLASYTLETDADVWEPLSNSERIREAMDNLATLYGKQVYSNFITGTSHSWLQDPFSGGAFSAYLPGQTTEIREDVSCPEDRLHFAGEHTSHFPCWIEGAVESGVRVAEEVNRKYAL